jgi:hypothetical protein
MIEQEVKADAKAEKPSRTWGEIFVMILSVPLLFAWDGYVVATLWRWFVLPLFAAAPALTWKAAMGLAFVARYVRGVDSRRDDPSEHVALRLAKMFSWPAVALGVGYVMLAVG